MLLASRKTASTGEKDDAVNKLKLISGFGSVNANCFRGSRSENVTIDGNGLKGPKNIPLLEEFRNIPCSISNRENIIPLRLYFEDFMKDTLSLSTVPGIPLTMIACTMSILYTLQKYIVLWFTESPAKSIFCS
mmetsp:Transcript_31544/g.43050  ORF Transcript_31544/g.43050 Transcript_31544/m.43050 type:complete len:133 (-) Transcript_31544:121-519(-)